MHLAVPLRDSQSDAQTSTPSLVTVERERNGALGTLFFIVIHPYSLSSSPLHNLLPAGEGGKKKALFTRLQNFTRLGCCECEFAFLLCVLPFAVARVAPFSTNGWATNNSKENHNNQPPIICNKPVGRMLLCCLPSLPGAKTLQAKSCIR